MFLIPLVIFLPLIEIAGFIVIGGRIGFTPSLLWVMTDMVIGFILLSTVGARLQRQPAPEKAAEEMFNTFCIIAGALLLIFPGFISDFMALPLLIPLTRRWIFLFLKHKHASILGELNKTSQGFTYWYEERSSKSGAPVKTIEGDFRKMDDDKKLD